MPMLQERETERFDPIALLIQPARQNVLLERERKPEQQRIKIVQWVTVVLFVFLLANFWDLQIRSPDYYAARAERNRLKATRIQAPRGRIVDRDGRVIVDNQASYSLLLVPRNVNPKSLQKLADGLNLDVAELIERVKRYRRTQPAYAPILIKEDLSPAELSFVEAHRGEPDFPEVEVVQTHRRLYPRGGIAAHLIGYVGEVSESELAQLEFARYEPGQLVGKAGVERQYNHWLTGIDGERRVLVDSRGRERQLIGIKPPVPGRDLQLTIDLDLQVVAELAMEGRRGAVVALDPRNGEILALVSRPTFDPNRFTGRMHGEEWTQLVNDPDKPLLNRAIQAQLAPGSTIKPIIALAGLATGVITPDFAVYCNGGATFYGRFFRCHQRGGHGRVTLYEALVQSCDVYFYTVGTRLGIQRLARYARLMGFGQATGVDLPNEAAGLVPDEEWKFRIFHQRWYPSETVSVAIGQGALTVTPLQLAYAIGGMAMGGVWYPPHVRRLPESELRPRVQRLDSVHVAEIVQALYGVVNDNGTGVRARIPGLEVCGKTGTAQLVSLDKVAHRGLPDHLEDNAWFVGFAPRTNPEIVVVALLENAGHGYLAAPVVRDVIKAYFDKKARMARQPDLAHRPWGRPTWKPQG